MNGFDYHTDKYSSICAYKSKPLYATSLYQEIYELDKGPHNPPLILQTIWKVYFELPENYSSIDRLVQLDYVYMSNNDE